MADTATDLIALTAQVKRLSGDLDRRFEQFSTRFSQLDGRFAQLSDAFTQLSERTDRRIDALSVKEKFSLPFSPALDQTWVDGTTNPAVSVVRGGIVSIAQGTMPIALPDRSRIQVLGASVRVDLAGFQPKVNVSPRLGIQLGRIALDTNSSEPIVQLSFQPLVAGSPDQQGVPNPGREFVDNDRFKYFVTAGMVIVNPPFGATFVVPAGMVVLQAFRVDCIGA